MNTIKPATPLPWARCVRSHKSVTGNMNAGAIPSKVAHVGCSSDRAYIVHACNAYPRLVEDDSAEAIYAILCSDLGGDIPERILSAQEHIAKRRALLRELGEGA